MNDQPQIPVRCYGVAAYILRRELEDWQVLLLRRLESLEGAWCQVAGKLEAGETAWQAALREIREETGLVPDSLYSADVCEQFYETHRDSIWVAPVFVGFVTSRQEVRLNPEHDAFKWVGFDEAEEMLPFAGQRRILEQIHREFVDRSPNPWLRIDLQS